MDLTVALLGTWMLEQYGTTRLTDGRTRYPLGEDAHGLITYQADGWMSVQIAAAHRVPYADGALHGGTSLERSAAAAGYLAYAGRYHLDGDTVIHHPSVSLFPNWERVNVPRRARIIGDRLTLDLREPITIDGEQWTGTLIWRRPTPPVA